MVRDVNITDVHVSVAQSSVLTSVVRVGDRCSAPLWIVLTVGEKTSHCEFSQQSEDTLLPELEVMEESRLPRARNMPELALR